MAVNVWVVTLLYIVFFIVCTRHSEWVLTSHSTNNRSYWRRVLHSTTRVKIVSVVKTKTSCQQGLTELLFSLCVRSFDSLGLGNAMARGSVGGRDGTETATGAQTGDELMPTGARRNSFLYRSTDSITDISPMSLSRKVSAASGEA